MRKRSRNSIDSNQEPLNIWAAFTDMMSNVFLISMLFLLITVVSSLFVKISSDKYTSTLIGKNLQCQQEVNASSETINNLNNQCNNLKNQIENSVPLKFPPIITISDAGKYGFDSGKANMKEGLMTKYIYEELPDEIEKISKEYQLNIVEVIGHTDGVPINGTSNLDDYLPEYARGIDTQGNKVTLEKLNYGSNAELGLLRAMEVVKALQVKQKKDKRLLNITFRAYSAAQLVTPKGDFAPTSRENEPERRRIEIRFTKAPQEIIK